MFSKRLLDISIIMFLSLCHVQYCAYPVYWCVDTTHYRSLHRTLNATGSGHAVSTAIGHWMDFASSQQLAICNSINGPETPGD